MTITRTPRGPATRRPTDAARSRNGLPQPETSLGIVLIILVVAFSLLSGRFANLDTIKQVTTDMSIVVIVSVGLALVLFTKNIDVSVGSMVGLTAFFGASFTANNPEIPLLLTVLLTCLLGLVLGAVNGALVATLNVPSIMVTLGTLYIYRGLTSLLAGAEQVTAQNLPAAYNQIADWSVAGIPGLFIYAVGIAGAAHVLVKHTMPGRAMLAVGSNRASAEKMGIAPKRLVFLAYAATGLLCGFAGVLWGARYGTVDSAVASGFELVVLATVVVGGVSITGGVGSMPGVFLGAAILSVISIGLALLNVSAFWLQAVQGLVIILAIVSGVVLSRRLDSKGTDS